MTTKRLMWLYIPVTISEILALGFLSGARLAVGNIGIALSMASMWFAFGFHLGEQAKRTARIMSLEAENNALRHMLAKATEAP